MASAGFRNFGLSDCEWLRLLTTQFVDTLGCLTIGSCSNKMSKDTTFDYLDFLKVLIRNEPWITLSKGFWAEDVSGPIRKCGEKFPKFPIAIHESDSGGLAFLETVFFWKLSRCLHQRRRTSFSSRAALSLTVPPPWKSAPTLHSFCHSGLYKLPSLSSDERVAHALGRTNFNIVKRSTQWKG